MSDKNSIKENSKSVEPNEKKSYEELLLENATLKKKLENENSNKNKIVVVTTNNDFLLTQTKTFKDEIHGDIQVTLLACKFINTKIYGRTKRLEQLGVCSEVYPCANHNRFCHMLGVYHLAGEMLNNLIKNSTKREINMGIYSVPELKGYQKLDKRLCELIKISALCHDIGHGPHSHLFDLIVPHDPKEPMTEHEHRSCVLMEIIIKENNIPITEDEIKFMKNVINPDPKIHKGFLYEIVANKSNSIDVDKMDYEERDSNRLGLNHKIDSYRIMQHAMVIGNKICYNKKIAMDLFQIFNSRYLLHKKAYTNKTVIGIQQMFIEIMTNIEHKVKFTEAAKDMNKFINLDDTTMHNFMKQIDVKTEKDPKLIQAKEIYERYQKRQLYNFIGEDVLSGGLVQSNKKNDLFVTSKDICAYDNTLDEKDIYIYQASVGYISGKYSNPLENIDLYVPNKTTKKITIEKFNLKTFTSLNTANYQETIIKVYSKNPDPIIIEKIRTAYNSLIKSLNRPSSPFSSNNK